MNHVNNDSFPLVCSKDCFHGDLLVLSKFFLVPFFSSIYIFAKHLSLGYLFSEQVPRRRKIILPGRNERLSLVKKSPICIIMFSFRLSPEGLSMGSTFCSGSEKIEAHFTSSPLLRVLLRSPDLFKLDKMKEWAGLGGDGP